MVDPEVEENKKDKKIEWPRIVAAIGFCFVVFGLIRILNTFEFQNNAQTGLGHIEKINFSHKENSTDGTGHTFFLRVKYVTPALNVTAIDIPYYSFSNTPFWGPDQMVTFLFNPQNPSEMKLPGFEQLYMWDTYWLFFGLCLLWSGIKKELNAK